MTPLCVCAEWGPGCDVANWTLAAGLFLLGAIVALAAVAFGHILADNDG